MIEVFTVLLAVFSGILFGIAMTLTVITKCRARKEKPDFQLHTFRSEF